MKKALLVREAVYDSLTDFTHGFERCVDRIVVPGEGGLALTVIKTGFNQGVFVCDGFDCVDREDLEILKEIEIPDELVELGKARMAGDERIRGLVQDLLS